MLPRPKIDHLVAAGMAEFEVPVTQCEVWAVTTAFDTDSSGQVKTNGSTV